MVWAKRADLRFRLRQEQVGQATSIPYAFTKAKTATASTPQQARTYTTYAS